MELFSARSALVHVSAKDTDRDGDLHVSSRHVATGKQLAPCLPRLLTGARSPSGPFGKRPIASGSWHILALPLPHLRVRNYWTARPRRCSRDLLPRRRLRALLAGAPRLERKNRRAPSSSPPAPALCAYSVQDRQGSGGQPRGRPGCRLWTRRSWSRISTPWMVFHRARLFGCRV